MHVCMCACDALVCLCVCVCVCVCVSSGLQEKMEVATVVVESQGIISHVDHESSSEEDEEEESDIEEEMVKNTFLCRQVFLNLFLRVQRSVILTGVMKMRWKKRITLAIR